MPAPSDELIAIVGEVEPFERYDRLRGIISDRVKEQFEQISEKEIYDATDNGLPPNAKLPEKEDENQLSPDKKYLWVLRRHKLEFSLEKLNPKEIKHTNITGGARALAGGELWFTSEKKISINQKSQRYGCIEKMAWEEILKYFRTLGYEVVDVSDFTLF